MGNEPDPVATLLRDSGLRPTPPRLYVLTALSRRSPQTVRSLLESRDAHLATVGAGTLHRALTDLARRGLVTRVHQHQGPAAYSLTSHAA